MVPGRGRFRWYDFPADGVYLYFVKGEKGATIRSLYQVPVLGGAPRKLIEDVDSPITFSPDGKRFAFVRGSRTESNLIIVNADGSGEQTLLAYKQPDNFLQPAWSPDGGIAASTRRWVADFAGRWSGSGIDGSEKIINTQVCSDRWHRVAPETQRPVNERGSDAGHTVTDLAAPLPCQPTRNYE